LAYGAEDESAWKNQLATEGTEENRHPSSVIACVAHHANAHTRTVDRLESTLTEVAGLRQQHFNVERLAQIFVWSARLIQ
jgi:hypothetical protein